MPSTTTTTTTEKPNDGSFAACNKEGAVLQCAPCRDTGVDVFFCNRECQVKQWKTHRAVCKKTSNSDSKSGANKEEKAEGNKGLPDRLCANCLKAGDDIGGSKLSVCSKCKKTYYCSRECQVEDWPEHKNYCKHICETYKHMERSFDSSEMNIYHLFQKWLPKTEMKCIGHAMYHALKKKGIEQQPPVKVVFLEVEFDYNAQTFVLAEAPRAVAIADLDQEHKEDIIERWKHQKNKAITQFAVVSTKELGERYESHIPIDIAKSVLDQMKYDHNNTNMYKMRNICAKVRLKSNTTLRNQLHADPIWCDLFGKDLLTSQDVFATSSEYTNLQKRTRNTISNQTITYSKGEDRDGASSGDYEKNIFEQASDLLTCSNTLEEGFQKVLDHFTNTGSNLEQTTIYWRCEEFGRKEYLSERIRFLEKETNQPWKCQCKRLDSTTAGTL